MPGGGKLASTVSHFRPTRPVIENKWKNRDKKPVVDAAGAEPVVWWDFCLEALPGTGIRRQARYGAGSG